MLLLRVRMTPSNITLNVKIRNTPYITYAAAINIDHDKIKISISTGLNINPNDVISNILWCQIKIDQEMKARCVIKHTYIPVIGYYMNSINK